MSINRGKDFERVVKEAFERVSNTSVDRLHDQMNGFAGSTNICDFIVYRKPYQYYVECKSVHGNTFPLSNVTRNQWQGLLAKSKINGVLAGVMCWWVDKDVTKFITIQELEACKNAGYKSVRYEHDPFTIDGIIEIPCKKRKVFFEYDMDEFFDICRLINERKIL